MDSPCKTEIHVDLVRLDNTHSTLPISAVSLNHNPSIYACLHCLLMKLGKYKNID